MALKRRASGLIIPTSSSLHQRTPRWKCIPCGTEFFEGESGAYERHVATCSAADEYVQARSYYLRFPAAYQPYNPDFGDVEWQRWIDKNKEERPEQAAKWFRTGDDH